MKKIFYTMIGIAICLNIVLPGCVYSFWGFFYEYFPVDEKYVYISASILTFVLFVFGLTIFFSKHGKKGIESCSEIQMAAFGENEIEILFWISMLLNIYNAMRISDFSDIIGGAANGTLLAYVQFFFDMRFLYFGVLLKAYRRGEFRNIILPSAVYLVVTVLYASRSGVFWIVFFNICLLASIKTSRYLKKKIIILLLPLCLIAPFIFAFSTNQRGVTENTVSYFAKLIVARLSYIEAGGIELEQYANGTYEEELFREKYGLENQAKQVINSALPGDLFEYDVQPNQYWRAIFAKWNPEACVQYYSSMYMMFPIYMILKYGYVLGILFSVIILYVLYVLICRIKNKILACFMASYFFYSFFEFFDWSYHFRDLLTFLLTILAVRTLYFLRKKIYFCARKRRRVICNEAIM